MLSAVEQAGLAAGEAAANRARRDLARSLRAALPGVSVTIAGDDILLVGRIDANDPRLRWVASIVR